MPWRTLLPDDARRAPSRFSTERIDHNQAAEGGILASPVPLARRICANVCAVFEFSAENAEIEDWLAEGTEFEL
jgi:hypothetical protein